MATMRLEERGTQIQVCFIFQLGTVIVLAFTTHSLIQCPGKSIKKFLPVSLHSGVLSLCMHMLNRSAWLELSYLIAVFFHQLLHFGWLVRLHPTYQYLISSQQVPLDSKVLLRSCRTACYLQEYLGTSV